MGDSGLFGYPYLDLYWSDADRHPFLIHADGKLAGFALVKKGSYLPDREQSSQLAMQVAEFFVLRKYRRMGVGTQAAKEIFRRFPGRWEVTELPQNTAAQAFWRKVIGAYTGGNFSEVSLDNVNWQGPVQVFELEDE